MIFVSFREAACALKSETFDFDFSQYHNGSSDNCIVPYLPSWEETLLEPFATKMQPSMTTAIDWVHRKLEHYINIFSVCVLNTSLYKIHPAINLQVIRKINYNGKEGKLNAGETKYLVSRLQIQVSTSTVDEVIQEIRIGTRNPNNKILNMFMRRDMVVF